MKILLLGKNGQLGAEIFRLATEQKEAIVAFGREELDITDYKRVSKAILHHKPDVVINASAYHVVSECEIYPEKAFQINALSLKPIADICEERNIRLVHFSTDYVFDGKKGRQYREDDKANPVQMYGISKIAGEYIVLQYCQRGIVVRTCGVYGGKNGSRVKKGNFVLSILKQMEGKKELEVSSEQIVSPSYATDVAEATLQLLQKEDAKGIYHLVNKGYCSWAQFAEQIALEKGIRIRIIPVNRGGMAGALRRPLFSALKNTRAEKLGVTLPIWQDAVKRYLKSLNN